MTFKERYSGPLTEDQSGAGLGSLLLLSGIAGSYPNTKVKNALKPVRTKEGLERFKQQHSDGYTNNYKNFDGIVPSTLRGLKYAPLAAVPLGLYAGALTDNADVGLLAGGLGLGAGALTSVADSIGKSALAKKLQEKERKIQKKEEQKKDILAKIEGF